MSSPCINQQNIQNSNCKFFDKTRDRKILGIVLAILLGLGVVITGGTFLIKTNNPLYISLLVTGIAILALGMANTDNKSIKGVS